MKCDFCSNDASVEIVVFVDGEAQKIRMCSSCYKEKLQEMMQNMPQEWGGVMLSEQLNAMLEKAEEGGFFESMEFKVNRNPHSGEEKFTFQKMSQEKPIEADSKKSARDIAFDEQLKSLRRKRSDAIEELELALEQEEYEKCAKLRDEIAEIGDALVRMNEERKNPHGV